MTAQAKNHLMRSEKFENISDELPRTEQLIKQYDDLYSQIRLDAMDDLDNIESLNCLERSGEIKSHISFAIMTVRSQLYTDGKLNKIPARGRAMRMYCAKCRPLLALDYSRLTVQEIFSSL